MLPPRDGRGAWAIAVGGRGRAAEEISLHAVARSATWTAGWVSAGVAPGFRGEAPSVPDAHQIIHARQLYVHKSRRI